MNRTLFQTFLIILFTGCRTAQVDDWTATLHDALQGTTRLRVRSGGTCCRNTDVEKTLLDVQDRETIAELIHGIQINSGASGFYCMCCGDPTLEFYRGDTLVASVSIHHGRSLRWRNGDWNGDGLLTEESAEFLVDWLAGHGISDPKKEREENIRNEKELAAAQEKWLKAMPHSLKPFWTDMADPFGSADAKKLDAALRKQHPETKPRILSLLSWFGSGQGPWSEFPWYEWVAEELLLLYKTQEILAAIEGERLTEQQMEGLARLLAGENFARQRPNDLRLVPAELKARLLRHSLQCDDEDKQARARRAFGDITMGGRPAGGTDGSPNAAAPFAHP